MQSSRSPSHALYLAEAHKKLTTRSRCPCDQLRECQVVFGALCARALQFLPGVPSWRGTRTKLIQLPGDTLSPAIVSLCHSQLTTVFMPVITLYAAVDWPVDAYAQGSTSWVRQVVRLGLIHSSTTYSCPAGVDNSRLIRVWKWQRLACHTTSSHCTPYSPSTCLPWTLPYAPVVTWQPLQ